MNRGDIHYIHRAPTTGNEIKTEKARPAVIVSNNSLNHHAGVVEVVFLTTKPKKEQATHVTVECKGVTSTALCEQINTVSTQRVGDYCGTCTADEMKRIDNALMASLDIVDLETLKKLASKQTEGERWLIEQLGKVTAERDRYAKMLDLMLSEAEA